jgi:glucosylceramidase
MKISPFITVGALLLAGSMIACKSYAPTSDNGTATTVAALQPQVWLTDPGAQVLFRVQPAAAPQVSADLPVIQVDESQRYQQMDGFGCTLTGGSALVLHRMQPAARTALLKELFDTTGTHIGISYLRISVGASDLDEKVFSYDDLPAGQTDTALIHFSLAPDRAYLLPVLKEILAINPHIKIMGSPWSPPAWMKTNGDTRGGSLLPQYANVYANYLARYIHEMQQEGVRLDALTVQNEPLHPGNNPSLLMPAQEQAVFVKNNLGPAFSKAGITTKIIVYDHNADKPEYPISILNDPEARKYVDGSAFHLYGGTIDALSKVHEAHPDKNLYFTEQWLGAPGNLQQDLAFHIKQLTIGASRNWCKTVLEWNLASDPQYQPHTNRGGCDRCLGALTIDGDAFIRNPAYYIMAHGAKFVRPGSWRIASNEVASLPNVAFTTPGGKKVLVVLNSSQQSQAFLIQSGKAKAAVSLAAGAVATYVW